MLHFEIKLCIDHVVFVVVYLIYADITVVLQKWEFGGKMCLNWHKYENTKKRNDPKTRLFFRMFPLQISQIVEFI